MNNMTYIHLLFLVNEQLICNIHSAYSWRATYSRFITTSIFIPHFLCHCFALFPHLWKRLNLMNITQTFSSPSLSLTNIYMNIHLAYPPPSNNSNIIVIILAAITGNFKYWTACNNPIACTWNGRSDGLHPILFTSSRPYLAKNRFLCSIRMEFVNSSPAYGIVYHNMYFFMIMIIFIEEKWE